MKTSILPLSKFVDFSRSSHVVFMLVCEIVLGIVLILIALTTFLKIGEDVMSKEVISFDATVIHFLYSFRNPAMTTVMKTITFFGGEVFLGMAIVITILLLFRHHKKDAYVFGFILTFGIILNLLLKSFFRRPRPDFMPLVHESSFSFPSGHAMNSFIFYACLSFFVFRQFKNKRLGLGMIVFSAILVLLIGISRIYLGVHYPSDVLAGYVAGLGWFVLVLVFEKTLLFLRMFRTYESNKKY